MRRDEVLAAARAAHEALTKLSRHAWNYRGTASEFLNDEESAAVDDATESLENALRRYEAKP